MTTSGPTSTSANLARRKVWVRFGDFVDRALLFPANEQYRASIERGTIGPRRVGILALSPRLRRAVGRLPFRATQLIKLLGKSEQS